MAECVNPFTLSAENGGHSVPCGKCSICLQRRASQWSFRLLNQYNSLTTDSAHFITLTYDTDYVPITSKGFMTLDARDPQLFFKRLRKAHKTSKKITYYLVGEYGGTTKRPHYHAIIFNCDIKLLQNAWQKGSIHYGTVTAASVGYVLKYISKPKQIPAHSNDDRIPEFARMSKGIGASYLTSAMVNWHNTNEDHRMYCNLLDGKKVAMPRYYKLKIYEDEQRKKIGEATRQRQLSKEEVSYTGKRSSTAKQLAKVQADCHTMAFRSRSKDRL